MTVKIDLKTYFERIEAKRVVFISDACYSGAAGGRSFNLAKIKMQNFGS